SLAISAKGSLRRDAFIASFDKLFSEGIRKQVAKGTPVKVRQVDIDEAHEDGADPCGRLGDWVVQMPPEVKIDSSKDDEAFLRLVFRVVRGRAVFYRVIGCS
ncbi:MAG TPA: hypothetical protein VFO27_19145, partial [Bryobacteraceae bacterium]|nr:hypothetical protein [Bryobacteraceae bacterium]